MARDMVVIATATKGRSPLIGPAVYGGSAGKGSHSGKGSGAGSGKAKVQAQDKAKAKAKGTPRGNGKSPGSAAPGTWLHHVRRVKAERGLHTLAGAMHAAKPLWKKHKAAIAAGAGAGAGAAGHRRK